MDQARVTIKVEGLDCPVEVAALRSALEGAVGIVRLDFDLLHGLMTVHYRDTDTTPAELLRRISIRTGMRASLLDAPTESSRLRDLGRRFGPNSARELRSWSVFYSMLVTVPDSRPTLSPSSSAESNWCRSAFDRRFEDAWISTSS